MIGQLRNEQLGQIALGIHRMQILERFFAIPQGVVVASAREQQAVNMLQGFF